jgi:hypothetical protein
MSNEQQNPLPAILALDEAHHRHAQEQRRWASLCRVGVFSTHCGHREGPADQLGEHPQLAGLVV